MYLKSLLKIVIVFVGLSLVGGCSQKPPHSQQVSYEDLSSDYGSLCEKYLSQLESNPEDTDLRLEAAKFFYNFRDYSKVVEVLVKNADLKSRMLLAKTYVHLKNYDNAIKVFEQVVSAHTDHKEAVSAEQIDVKGLEPEFIYFYGKVLEEKNLFPKALAIYSQVPPPYEADAKKRMSDIKSKVEFGIPQYISELSKKSESFIEQSKDDAAVILLVDEETSILDDKTSISSVHVIEKILQERGKALAEIVIGYDSTYQRVELEFARTITQDGKLIYAGDANTRDVSRYLNYPLYSNSRAFIVSMPSVEEGAIIEYKVKIYSSKLTNEDDFSFIYRLRERLPIYKALFRLNTPIKAKVRFKFFNLEYANGVDLSPKIIESDKKISYEWEFNEIKPIIPEYNMPPASEINPAFMVSSFKDWDEIYRWWRRLYLDKLSLDDEIKGFIDKLINSADTDNEKAKLIHEFVAKDIRYVAIEYGDSGYEPHHAKEVFVNRYGDCKDQAILLVSMMRYAGLKAYPVLIPTRGAYKIDKEFASINFDHAIAAIDLNNELIFMDPTSSTNPFGGIPLSDQDRTVMVFFEDTFKIAHIHPKRDNKVAYHMDITLSKDEDASIKRSVSTRGFFASGYRYYLKYTHPAIIKEDIMQKMMEISSLSKFKDYKIEHADDFDFDPKLTYTFSAEKFLNPARDLRIIPVLDQIGLDHNVIGKEKREFPLDFNGVSEKTANINIRLPGNLMVRYLPESKTLENPWFKLVVSYRDNNNVIEFYENFSIKKRFVERRQYQEFKNYFKEAIYLLREEVILKKR